MPTRPPQKYLKSCRFAGRPGRYFLLVFPIWTPKIVSEDMLEPSEPNPAFTARAQSVFDGLLNLDLGKPHYWAFGSSKGGRGGGSGGGRDAVHPRLAAMPITRNCADTPPSNPQTSQDAHPEAPGPILAAQAKRESNDAKTTR